MPAPRRASRPASSRTLEVATDPTLAAALEKWRASRDPADADAVEAAGTKDEAWKKRVALIARTSGKLPDIVARMKTVADLEDDPRLTTVMLGWLHEARWPGSGAAGGWPAIFERFITLEDARAIAPLRQMASSLPDFLGAKHRAFIAGELTRTAEALERATPKARVTQPIVLGPAKDPLTIIQRVFDAPGDDDVRRVVADQLLEQGDVWGELIQLGFLIAEGKATEEQRRTAELLIKKNAARFAGPIAKIAKADSREFEKGFLKRVLVNAVMVGRPAWEAAATSPYWSTVARLEIDMISTPKWWTPAIVKNPALGQLRELSFNRYYVPFISLERATTTAPWRVVAVNIALERWLRFLRAFVHALPEEERNRFEVAPIPQRNDVLRFIADAR
ncbi:MAG: hypothetical protein U0270_05875 [Labilithrix sp.]